MGQLGKHDLVGMYLYNVTVNVDSDIQDNWLQWMKDAHIPDVLATGQFLDCQLTRVMLDEESGVTYAMQYRFASMADYQLYQEIYAPDLQHATQTKYGDKLVAFRTLLEIIDTQSPQL